MPRTVRRATAHVMNGAAELRNLREVFSSDGLASKLHVFAARSSFGNIWCHFPESLSREGGPQPIAT
jgi:hypothetical protein